MDEREFDVMRTYARAWKTDIVMYHLFGIPLWFPVSLRQAAFFMGGLVFTFSLSRVIPRIMSIPVLGDPITIFTVYPYLIMKFFTKMTLDGKPPHIYFKDQIMYFISDKKYNMYRPIKPEEKITFFSQVSFRVLRLVSKIDIELLRKGER